MTAEICRHETFKDICAICHSNSVIDKQAAKIEQLQRWLDAADASLGKNAAEIERLRGALRHISALAPNQGNAMQIKARAALAQEKKDE